MILLFPTRKPHITQKYGNKSALYATSHNGVDFRVKNDPDRRILAAADGEVVRVHMNVKPFFVFSGGKWKKTEDFGKGSYYGNEIAIRHEQGGKVFFTKYGHNEEVFLKKGDKVKAGQMIARGGNTGYSQGDHLHFMAEWGLDGKHFDPTPFFGKEGGEKRTDWEKELEEAEKWVKEHGISNGDRPKDLVTREEQNVREMRLARKIMEWIQN